MPLRRTASGAPTARHLCVLGRPIDQTGPIATALAGEPSFRVRCHETLAAAQQSAPPFDLTLVPLEYARHHTEELFGRDHPPPVAVYADQPDCDEAVRWLRAGAVDFIPLDPARLAALPARLHALFAPRIRPPTPHNPLRKDHLARQLAVVVEKLDEGLALSDEHGRLLIFNRRLRRITGYSRSLANSLPEFLRTLFPAPGELRRVEERVREAFATGTPREAEAAARTRTGDNLLLSIELSPIRVGGHLWLLGSYRDITARRRTEAAAELREVRSQNFNHTLATLAGDERLFHGYQGADLRLIAETTAHALGIARVGIWFFTPDHTGLRCAEIFDQRAHSHEAGRLLSAAEFPEYFTALAHGKIIAAGDAAHDPATRDFATGYLQPLGIGATLDIPVRFGGRIVGTVCHEHVGPPASGRPRSRPSPRPSAAASRLCSRRRPATRPRPPSTPPTTASTRSSSSCPTRPSSSMPPASSPRGIVRWRR